MPCKFGPKTTFSRFLITPHNSKQLGPATHLPAIQPFFSQNPQMGALNYIGFFIGNIKALIYGTALFGFVGSLQIIQLASLLLTPISRRLVFNINSGLCGVVWTVMQYILEKQHQAHITFSGDEIPDEESAIVMANHRSWTDFYMVHSVAIRKKMLSNCKYFVKDSIKFLPIFGWGMWLMGMIFVKRNWVKDQQKIDEMFSKINEFKPPVWVISFVEGTRFTPQKLLDGQLFSQERGLPVMKNLLVPRTKGFVACVQKLRGTHVHYIYDLTIAYNHRVESQKGFGVAPDMVRVHAGRISPEFDFHIHVRRYPIAELPLEDEALAEWVRERYLEKDRVLERLKDKWIDGIEGGVWEENW